MKISTRNIGRHITRFENAVREHAFLGTIPVYSDDREEQERIDEVRGKIIRDYDLARANLTRFCIEAIVEGTNR